jgi:hypothetical protein
VSYHNVKVAQTRVGSESGEASFAALLVRGARMCNHGEKRSRRDTFEIELRLASNVR